MENWLAMNLPLSRHSAAVEPSECAACGANARIGNGACIGCLLRAGLDEEPVNEAQDFDQTLREIEIRDGPRRCGDRSIPEEIGREDCAAI